MLTRHWKMKTLGALALVAVSAFGLTGCENDHDAAHNCDLVRMQMEMDGRLQTKTQGDGTWGTWDAAYEWLNGDIIQYNCRVITLTEFGGGYATFIIQEDVNNGTDVEYYSSGVNYWGWTDFLLHGQQVMCDGRHLPSPQPTC